MIRKGFLITGTIETCSNHECIYYGSYLKMHMDHTILWTQLQYSWNTANVGIKHQPINLFFEKSTS
jgi:hypothetical protein